MPKEIYDPNIPRVDAVDEPATGIPFLILKQLGAVRDPADIQKAADGDADGVSDIETDVDAAHVDGDSVSDREAAAADPGDPAWEAVDAAKARVIVDALVQARAELRELCAREQAEMDPDGYGASDQYWQLSDAIDMVDCALSCIAVFAVNEQQEAEDALEAATAAARSAGVIKTLAARFIKKEAAQMADTTEGAAPAPVTKADGDDGLLAVYDAKGNLLGAVQPDALTPLSTNVPADSAAATEGDAPAESAGDGAAPAAAAPAEKADAPAAAPAAPAAAPAAPAAPAANPNEPASQQDVAKNSQLSESELAAVIAKAVDAKVAELIAPLRETVEKIANQPRPGGPMLQGAIPGGTGIVAQRGYTPGGVESDEALVKRLGAETDSGTRMVGVAELIQRAWGVKPSN